MRKFHFRHLLVAGECVPLVCGGGLFDCQPLEHGGDCLHTDVLHGGVCFSVSPSVVEGCKGMNKNVENPNLICFPLIFSGLATPSTTDGYPYGCANSYPCTPSSCATLRVSSATASYCTGVTCVRSSLGCLEALCTAPQCHSCPRSHTLDRVRTLRANAYVLREDGSISLRPCAMAKAFSLLAS